MVRIDPQYPRGSCVETCRLLMQIYRSCIRPPHLSHVGGMFRDGNEDFIDYHEWLVSLDGKVIVDPTASQHFPGAMQGTFPCIGIFTPADSVFYLYEQDKEREFGTT